MKKLKREKINFEKSKYMNYAQISSLIKEIHTNNEEMTLEYKLGREKVSFGYVEEQFYRQENCTYNSPEAGTVTITTKHQGSHYIRADQGKDGKARSHRGQEPEHGSQWPWEDTGFSSQLDEKLLKVSSSK